MSSEQKNEIPINGSTRSRMVNFGWLYLARGLVLVTGILVFRWANTILGTDSFSEYAMARRTISLLAPAMVMGLGVGLPRRIAMLVGEGRQDQNLAFFWSAFSCVLLSNLLVMGLAVTFPGAVAKLFMADRKYSGLILPIALSLTGLSWHNLVWAYLRGRFFFRAASILEIIDLVLIPVGAFLLFNDSTAQLLRATGLSVILVNFAVLVVLALRSGFDWSGHWRRGRELLSYGLPRVPGDFALGGLIAIPSIVAAHLFGLQIAGYVAFASAMLNLAGTAVAPMSTTLLPEAAQLISMGRLDVLKRDLKRLCLIAAGLSVCGLLVAEIWMPLILRVYLGSGFDEAVPVLRWFALCVLPYIQFVVMRSVIDAAYHRPVNTINLTLALATFGVSTLVLTRFHGGVEVILLATLIGHLVLFLLTFREIRKIFRNPGESDHASDS